jgi:phage tail protein X
MQFTSITHDESLDDLVARTYDLGAAPSKALLGRARAALIQANPFLQNLGDVPEGTMVAIPDLPTAAASAETVAPEQAAIGIGTDQFGGAVALAASDLMAELAGAAEQASGSLQALKSSEIKKLARGNEQLSAALPELMQAASARIDAGRGIQEYSKAAFAEMEADLAALRGAFG